MNKENKAPRLTNIAPTGIYAVVAVLLFAVNLYIYQFAPFEGTLNDTILNSLFTISALIVAAATTAIFLHYQPGDFPRKVWLYMMLGCWSWFFGEATWGGIAYISVEVPAPSIPDLGWVGGFILFTVALYYQYISLFPAQRKRIITVAAGAWLLAVFVPLITLLATQALTAETFINYFYPIADLFLGIAGIALVFVFQGGALMRPWIGLFFFAIADLFYAWAVQAGLYDWSAENSNLLTIAIDSLYLVAYLVFGFGLVGHWALITFGLRGER